jgi:hypothetical protein
MFDGTTPHEQHVIGPAKSQRDMVQASLNGEEGRARHDVYRARLGERRQGWRARLAHVEALLAGVDMAAAAPSTRERIELACEQIRAMIDGE